MHSALIVRLPPKKTQAMKCEELRADGGIYAHPIGKIVDSHRLIPIQASNFRPTTAYIGSEPPKIGFGGGVRSRT